MKSRGADFAADVEELVLPAGVVELDAGVGGDVEAAAELVGVDGSAAAERVEAAPERGSAGLLVHEHDRAGLRDLELAERRPAGRDRDADVEEPVRLRGLPPADARDERLVDDQALDEPRCRARVGLGE